ncbi:hypothetical protein ACOMHN_007968 [Nucella lapillus]
MSSHSPLAVLLVLLAVDSWTAVFPACDSEMAKQAASDISVSPSLTKTSKSVETENVENVDQVVVDKHFKKGHLKPFGESGPKVDIETRTEFPEPAEFFVNYVMGSKPLKLTGVARSSRAVRLWTDDYLLALDVPAGTVVQLETKKKESRQQESVEMHFHQFLQIYNQTEHYMVDNVPEYLRPDIMVPCSLQCTDLMKKGLAFALMWFSSGGTKSVIHTDAYDNINCLIRGHKTFVLVDPQKYRDKIFLRPDGFYSDIDVDSVDLTQSPSLKDMEFHHVTLVAGDCLYIPYKWIHQVRSFNSNVAVNFWWDHYASVDLHQSESACQGQCDLSLTLDQVDISETSGWESYENYFPSDAEVIANVIFDKMDLNKDGQFTTEEYAAIPVETWKEIQKALNELEVEGRENAEGREEAEEVGNKRDEL